MYEDRTQNDDAEIHETLYTLSPATSEPCADNSIAINTND